MSEMDMYKNFFKAYPSDTEEEDEIVNVEISKKEQENLKSFSEEETFLKGVAISMWQNSGDETSNWTKFVNEKNIFGNRYRVEDGSYNTFPNFWDNYENDIKLAKDIGCTAFRFSFEWSRIEPRKGEIDQMAIERYKKILDCLEKYKMEPVATLHHFTHPNWFQELGAFEEANNIPLFINYSKIVFETFSDRIKLWTTFNEPTVYMFLSYIAGVHSPGKHLRVWLSGIVLHNLLKSHIYVYNTLKKMKNGNNVKIGIVHNYIWFKPKEEGILNYPSKCVCQWFTYWWGRDIVPEFFRTGIFKWFVPMIGKVLEYEYGSKPPCDWWGINYYSRCVLTKFLKPTCKDGEIFTDMEYPIYPKGFYKALKAASDIGIPIYVTETGCPDAKDDKRPKWIVSYMNEVIRALKVGYDIRGFFYWTLIDNFEWNKGYITRFGLYDLDRKLRNGSKKLIEYYDTLPDKLSDLIQYAKKTKIEKASDVLYLNREQNER